MLKILRFEKNTYICDAEKELKELYPEIYISGAPEEKRKKWEVIKS